MIQQQDGAVSDRVPTCPAGLVNESGVDVRKRKGLCLFPCVKFALENNLFAGHW